MKSKPYTRPALIVFLLLLVFQGAAASAMGNHLAMQASQVVEELRPTLDTADCHSVTEQDSAHHADMQQLHHDHSADSGDCCSADGDCSRGHCSATMALTQLHLALSPWTLVHRPIAAASQAQAPVYPRFRPPISA